MIEVSINTERFDFYPAETWLRSIFSISINQKIMNFTCVYWWGRCFFVFSAKKIKQTRKCEAVFAYGAVNEDELELVVGEIIDIIKEVESLVAAHTFIFELKEPNSDSALLC